MKTLIPQRKIKPDPIIRNKYDWKIHKILDEAKRVYICPARGNGKLYNQLELYVDLMSKNRDIKIIRANDIKTAVNKFKYIPDAVLDKDFCDSEREWVDRMVAHCFETEMKEYLQKQRENWEPKIVLDTWPKDNAFHTELMLWASLNSDAIRIRKDDTE